VRENEAVLGTCPRRHRYVVNNAMRLIALVFSLGGLLALAGCGSAGDDRGTPASVGSVEGSPTSDRLNVVLGICDVEGLVVDVDESSTSQVGIAATFERQTSPAACATGVQVVLREALGDRTIVDVSTGRTLQLQPLTPASPMTPTVATDGDS
jgi:hypothetical protein